MALEYRDFERRDLDKFAAVVGRVFKDDAYTRDARVNHFLLRHELIDYLQRQNYAKVVLDGEAPVAILIAEIGRKKLRRPYDAEALICHIRLIFNSAGREYLKYRRGLRKTDMRLITGKRFNAELRLFIVVEGYRNMGVGHKLLLDFQNVCRQNGIYEYFLFTDSYCDVDYYVERGFRLEAQRLYALNKSSPPANYYLFTKDIT